MNIFRQPSADVERAASAVYSGGAIMQTFFDRPMEEQGIIVKNDKHESKVTASGRAINEAIVRYLAHATGDLTMTEEEEYTDAPLRRFTTNYDNLNAWCLDPDDGTRDYLTAIELGISCSLAGVSLGKIVDGRPQVGALNFPLLQKNTSRIYVAQEGQGAYYEDGDFRGRILSGDPAQREGVILVSENEHPHIDHIANNKGLTVVRLGGIAFKMMAVVDPTLIQTYSPRLSAEERNILASEPVVGMVSTSAALHDVAAATVVAREQEMLVSSITGEKDLPRSKGEHGIIVTRNEYIQDILVGAVAAERGQM